MAPLYSRLTQADNKLLRSQYTPHLIYNTHSAANVVKTLLPKATFHCQNYFTLKG